VVADKADWVGSKVTHDTDLVLGGSRGFMRGVQRDNAVFNFLPPGQGAARNRDDTILGGVDGDVLNAWRWQ